jgi:hypothetical protein
MPSYDEWIREETKSIQLGMVQKIENMYDQQ